MTSRDDTPKTALVRRIDPAKLGLPTKPVDDPELVGDALEHAAANDCNVLAPITKLQFLPPDHVVAFNVVLFDASFTDEQWNGKKRSNGTGIRPLIWHSNLANDLQGDWDDGGAFVEVVACNHEIR